MKLRGCAGPRRADRDVLQVGIVAGQPPGDRDGLRIGGVHAPGRGLTHPRQLVGVGATSASRARGTRGSAWAADGRARAPRATSSSVEGWPDGVFFFTGSFCRSNRISWICFGRAEVERLAGRAHAPALDFEGFRLPSSWLCARACPVEQHAVALHREQHRQHRHLDPAIDEVQLFVRLDLPNSAWCSAARQSAPRRRIRWRASISTWSNGCAGALAGDFLVARASSSRNGAARGCPSSWRSWTLEHVGLEQRVVRAAGERDAVVREDVRRELHVLRRPWRASARSSQGLSSSSARSTVELLRRAGVVVRERQVRRLAAEGERDADQRALIGSALDAIGVDADKRRAPRSGSELASARPRRGSCAGCAARPSAGLRRVGHAAARHACGASSCSQPLKLEALVQSRAAARLVGACRPSCVDRRPAAARRT